MIYTDDDIRNIVDSLHRANRRLLALAEKYGMDPRVAYLCAILYAGALDDVATAFGLAPSLTIPKREGVISETIKVLTE